MRDLETLSDEVLQLEPASREELARRLWASLEPLSESQIEELWAEEAVRRLEDYRAGRASAVPAESVLEEAARRLA